MTAPMYYADVYQSEHIHVCLFGFKNQDFVFPLHDHPEIYGFLKVIRGAVAVNSYSLLPDDEQEQAKRSSSKRFASLSNIVAVRFVAFDTSVGFSHPVNILNASQITVDGTKRQLCSEHTYLKFVFS